VRDLEDFGHYMFRISLDVMMKVQKVEEERMGEIGFYELGDLEYIDMIERDWSTGEDLLLPYVKDDEYTVDWSPSLVSRKLTRSTLELLLTPGREYR